MQPFVPKPLLAHTHRAGHLAPGSTYRYNLFSLTTPAGRSLYFMTAYRRRQTDEALEVSPVLGEEPNQALRIFRAVAEADGGVDPLHLVDVVRDLLLEQPARRAGWRSGTAAYS